MEAKARTQEAATKYPPVSFGIGVDQATGVSNAVLRIGNDFIHAPIELLGLFKMFTAAPELLEVAHLLAKLRDCGRADLDTEELALLEAAIARATGQEGK